MTLPVLVYCAAGNARLAEIAISAGYKYGAQLPRTVYHPLYMADQDYNRLGRLDAAGKARERGRYMRALAQHSPHMATVLDWERDEALPDVLDWAEEAAQHVERVLVVPKVIGGVSRLPRRIGGKDVVLAYSVPTRYGGTSVPVWEFARWPVHLLGGSPTAQMRLYSHLRGICEVVSADGNYAQKMATRYNQFYVPGGTASYASNRWWPTLTEADGCRWEGDAPYEAFRRSCINIMAAWEQLEGVML